MSRVIAGDGPQGLVAGGKSGHHLRSVSRKAGAGRTLQLVLRAAGQPFGSLREPQGKWATRLVTPGKWRRKFRFVLLLTDSATET